MKQFNYLFYLVLFLGFFLPSNSNFHISYTGVEFEVREIAFLLLPFLNLLCWSKNRVIPAGKKVQYLILLFISIVVVNELLKNLFYGGGLGATFKTIRIGLPLFSCLIILFFGLRADVKKVWRTLLWAITASAVLTLITPFVYLPIYPTIEGENIIEATRGRFINSNASFGIIGLYLLYKDSDKWYNRGLLIKITAILSIIILVISFNRTYLALFALAAAYLSFSEFSLRKAIKYISIPFLVLGVVWFTYNYSNVIQRQIDKRILNIVLGQTDLVESVYKDNRDNIYSSMYERIIENHWLIGLPYKKEIFIKESASASKRSKMTKTDVSMYNVLIRYGMIPTFILILIFKGLMKHKLKMFNFMFILYLLASLNIDSLVSHNSIFFLILILFIAFHEKKQQTHNSHNRAYIRTRV